MFYGVFLIMIPIHQRDTDHNSQESFSLLTSYGIFNVFMSEQCQNVGPILLLKNQSQHHMVLNRVPEIAENAQFGRRRHD